MISCFAIIHKCVIQVNGPQLMKLCDPCTGSVFIYISIGISKQIFIWIHLGLVGYDLTHKSLVFMASSHYLMLWLVCLYSKPCIKSTAGAGADVALVNVACNTTIELTCSDPSGFLPSWFMNGVVVFGDHYSSSSDVNTGVVTGTLTINGNHTYGAFNVYCSLHNGQILHNTSVTVQG